MNINVEKADVSDSLDLKCIVRVLEGPFVNFTGSVESIDREKRRVSVNVSILGRVVPVDLDFSQVERVNA
jgi:transcriptional antiterminator NusG